jgi:hypothetical protein
MILKTFSKGIKTANVTKYGGEIEVMYYIEEEFQRSELFYKQVEAEEEAEKWINE